MLDVPLFLSELFSDPHKTLASGIGLAAAITLYKFVEYLLDMALEMLGKPLKARLKTLLTGYLLPLLLVLAAVYVGAMMRVNLLVALGAIVGCLLVAGVAAAWSRRGKKRPGGLSWPTTGALAFVIGMAIAVPITLETRGPLPYSIFLTQLEVNGGPTEVISSDFKARTTSWIRTPLNEAFKDNGYLAIRPDGLLTIDPAASRDERALKAKTLDTDFQPAYLVTPTYVSSGPVFYLNMDFQRLLSADDEATDEDGLELAESEMQASTVWPIGTEDLAATAMGFSLAVYVLGREPSDRFKEGAQLQPKVAATFCDKLLLAAKQNPAADLDMDEIGKLAHPEGGNCKSAEDVRGLIANVDNQVRSKGADGSVAATYTTVVANWCALTGQKKCGP